MQEFFQAHTDTIRSHMHAILDEHNDVFSRMPFWGQDVVSRLRTFVSSGKLVRGHMVLFGNKLSADDVSADAYYAAAAIEFVHAALLIHDDVMDNDSLRRGETTMHKQYEALALQRHVDRPAQFGVAAGICVGDIAFFLAYACLNKIQSPASSAVYKILNEELCLVGLAQIQDIYLCQHGDDVAINDVFEVFMYKSAGYTYSVPLIMGAYLGGADEQTCTHLRSFGSALGVLFQIKDDELGLFGDEQAIGKPVGSDVRENKKTLFYHYLFAKASSEQKQQLSRIFGAQHVDENMMGVVRQLVHDIGAYAAVQEHITVLTKDAHTAVDKLAIRDTYKKELRFLIDYNLSRKT